MKMECQRQRLNAQITQLRFEYDYVIITYYIIDFIWPSMHEYDPGTQHFAQINYFQPNKILFT